MLSCTAVSWDNVDEEFISKPRQWDASGVGSFIIWSGPTSSIFDFATYIFMYFVFCPMFVSNGILVNDLPAYYSGAQLVSMQEQYIGMFQAGWIVESMWSQSLMIHMIRTQKLPFTGFGNLLGFEALAVKYFVYLIPCILLYMLLATSLKKAYIRHYGELL